MITTQLKKPQAPVRILMVEDNHADVFLMKEHLKEFIFPVDMSFVHDGEEALNVLRNSMCFSAKQDPDFILLDLDLPKMDGRKVLSEMKRDPGLKHIPVLILTHSMDEKDIHMAYENKANCYIVKSSNLKHFNNVVRSIEEFWLKSMS